MNISARVIFGVIIFLPINIAAFSSIFIFRRNRRGRRTPLNGNLLRGTGASLRTAIKMILLTCQSLGEAYGVMLNGL